MVLLRIVEYVQPFAIQKYEKLLRRWAYCKTIGVKSPGEFQSTLIIQTFFYIQILLYNRTSTQSSFKELQMSF